MPSNISSPPERRDIYDVVCIKKMRVRVIFEEEVTPEEAATLFLQGDFEDITDEETLKVISVEGTPT